MSVMGSTTSRTWGCSSELQCYQLNAPTAFCVQTSERRSPSFQQNLV